MQIYSIKNTFYYPKYGIFNIKINIIFVTANMSYPYCLIGISKSKIRKDCHKMRDHHLPFSNFSQVITVILSFINSFE
jgi:hypothetical protein